MLDQNEKWVDEYNEKRIKIRLAERSEKETGEPSEGELVRELYGKIKG